LEFKAFHSIDNNILLRNIKDQFELKIIIELNWLESYILDSRRARMFCPWHDANTQLTTTQSLAYLLMAHR
jgi:hypothetical protein